MTGGRSPSKPCERPVLVPLDAVLDALRAPLACTQPTVADFQVAFSWAGAANHIERRFGGGVQ